jgi:hypothetical protein
MSLVLSGSTSGSVTLQEPAVAGTTVIDLPATSGTMVVTGGAQTVQFAAGSASTPSITTTGDTNTGIYFPAADTIAFTEGGVESMRIDSSGNVGIGTSSPTSPLSVGTASYNQTSPTAQVNGANKVISNSGGIFSIGSTDAAAADIGGSLGFTANGGVNGYATGQISGRRESATAGNYASYMAFTTSNSGGSVQEKMRITSDGYVYIGRTGDTDAAGLSLGGDGFIRANRDGGTVLVVNRNTNDGTLVSFRQAGAEEGFISVTGTTVSYNGGHLSRWSQLPDGSKDESIVKGTVMSNLDNMCVWEKDGVVAENEQLNKMKVSDVEGDTNVAGVFVNWTIDADYGVDDMNVAMTGDMIIRIADGVVVQKGDLLMSAGDGTAKPQGDDIVRSKTIAKVTSNYVTCTYADGSYCVPCVLMAC